MLVAVAVLTLARAGLNVVPAFADHPGAVYQTNLLANAGGTLAGKYKTTIKSPAALKGTWVLTLTNRGAYTVANNGPNQILVHGRYSATGSRITFGHETGKGACATSGTYIWKNAIRPYLKSIDVLACPSNPFSKAVPGQHGDSANPKPGDNAEGYQTEPGNRMPISYAMNTCASSWYPADDKRTVPPIKMAQLVRAADTIIICENTWGTADLHGEEWLTQHCKGVFAHPAGKQANFVFFDGHAKSKKWLSTIYPISQNNWMSDEPSQDPNNRRIKGAPGCDTTMPPGPDAKVFHSNGCDSYQ